MLVWWSSSECCVIVSCFSAVLNVRYNVGETVLTSKRTTKKSFESMKREFVCPRVAKPAGGAGAEESKRDAKTLDGQQLDGL